MKYGTFVLASFLLAVLAASSVPLTAAPQKQTTKQLSGYNAIVVEKFTVDKNPATEDFPKGLETLMQSRAVEKLREKRLFEEVVDGSETAPVVGGAANAPAQQPKRLLLSGTIITFEKGSRAARYLGGFGAGQTKIKVRFAFRDAQTGSEVLRFDHQGTFKGMFSAFGGSKEEAFARAASGVVKGLISEIEKNR